MNIIVGADHFQIGIKEKKPMPGIINMTETGETMGPGRKSAPNILLKDMWSNCLLNTRGCSPPNMQGVEIKTKSGTVPHLDTKVC